jgi:hypothetical protein
MLFPQRLLIDGEGALIERPDLLIAAQCVIKHGEIVEGLSDIRMS